MGITPTKEDFQGLRDATIKLNVGIANLQAGLGESITYNTKELSSALDRLNSQINHNAQSNNRYAVAMKWLTFALVIVGLAQVFVALRK